MKPFNLTESTTKIIVAIILSAVAMSIGLDISYWRALLIVCAMVCAIGSYISEDLDRVLSEGQKGNPRE